MGRSGRRVFLAVEPTLLEGVLAQLLSARAEGDVVQLGHKDAHGAHGNYDAAVVSTDLPSGVRADVVITLPDTRGGGGTGTVRTGNATHTLVITAAEQVVALLEQYVPGPQDRGHG